MTYCEFLRQSGDQIQEQVTTNIDYDKDSVMLHNVLFYLIDTYYMLHEFYCHSELNQRLHIERLLQEVAKKLGAVDLNLKETMIQLREVHTKRQYAISMYDVYNFKRYK